MQVHGLRNCIEADQDRVISDKRPGPTKEPGYLFGGPIHHMRGT